MMIKNLPSDEVSKMMGYMRQAVKDTYFEKWLAAGGFQWPAEKVREVRFLFLMPHLCRTERE